MRNKVEEYIEYTKKANAVLQELLSEAKVFAEENRKLVSGEIVEIYAEGQFICEGVIGEVRSVAYAVFRHGGLLTMKYYLDEDHFNKVWNHLTYEVFAKKKDGSTSTKHALTNSHFIAMQGCEKSCDYYIKIKSL